MLLEGLHIPLTTPFHPNGRLNPHKLAANVARYSKSPAAGLIVLGPSGEPTLLSDDETRETLRTAAEAAAPEKVLIAGVSRDSVHATLTLANFAAEQLYDAILIGIPSVLSEDARFRVTKRDHNLDHWHQASLTYFRTVADLSPVPVILLRTDTHGIPNFLILELATHPNIRGLMDTGSYESQWAQFGQFRERTAMVSYEVEVTSVFHAVTRRMIQSSASAPGRAALVSIGPSAHAGTITAAPATTGALKTRTKTIGFQLIAGGASTMRDSLSGGASAIAPAFAACTPQACYELFAAWKDGDEPLAEGKHARLQPAAHLAEKVLGPGGLKFGCDLNGYFGGLPRLPHLPPTGEQRATLQSLMEGIRT